MLGMLSRAEAFPLSWDKLTESQRRAVENIAKLFGELAERPWEMPTNLGVFDRFLPRIDIERRNHVALIEGERGMGKTAVLLTLLSLWADRERNEARTSTTAPPEGVLRGRVVPVGLVDLQPLPEGTNLLVHLAGQLSRLVDAMDDGHRATVGHAWNPVKASEPGSRRQWRAFVQAAAAGWEGRLDTRRGSLDPEAFALEFEEVERHRLDVPERFRELCDALVDEYPRVFNQRRGTPFFVIAIDDADMNPSRVRELLDLVRTLWHPRVGFLLTGHHALFLDVLKEHLAKGRTQSGNDQTNLAEAIYQKAIPPHQRAHLPALPFSERREVVARTLARTKIFDHPLKPANLLDYIEVNRLAAMILPNNMRELMDWEVSLNRYGFDVETRSRMYGWGAHRKSISTLGIRLEGPDVGDIEIAGDISPTDPYYGEIHLGLAQDMLVSDAQSRAYKEKLPVVLGRTLHEHVSFDWPFPQWYTWLDYSALVYLLRNAFGLRVDESLMSNERFLGWRHGRCEKVFKRDHAVRTFIVWIVRYIEFRRDRIQSPVGPLAEALEQLSKSASSDIPGWEEIARQLDGIANDPERPSEERRWAALDIALFAAPEHGLSPEVANSILSRIKERRATSWSDAVATLRERRGKHATKALERGMSSEQRQTPEPSTIIEGIDARSSLYAWVSEVSRVEAPKDELMRLLAGFSNMPVGNQPMNLASYFELERWGVMYRTTSESLRNRWQDRLNRLPRGGVSAPLAALAMWNDAVRTGAAPALEELRGDPKPEELQRMYERLGIQPWGFRGGDEPLEVGGLKLRRAVLGWREETHFEGTLDGVLFEVLWSVVMDAFDSTTASGGLLAWWDPVGARREGESGTFPWPVPELLSFDDYRIFAASYNEQLRRIRGALDSLPHTNDVAGHFANYYVRALVELQEKRRITEEWSAGIVAPTWEILAQGSRVGESKGAKRRAFGAWFLRIPLLAAPESGLSPDTAKSILEAVRPNDDQKEVLRKARKERLRHMGTDEAQVDAVLAAIDAENEGHPWTREFSAVS